MQHRDLGTLDGPVLLFGGPYSNLHATQALFAQARGLKPAHVICTGDVVAYCGDPQATVDMVRASGCTVVAGNCERQLAAGAADCGCGFEAGTACDLLSAGWFAHADTHVSPDARAWMGTRPDVVSFAHHGARYAVIHGGVRDIARFVWPTSPDDVFEQEWHWLEQAIGPVDHVIAGHCGLPFVKTLEAGRWINAGVIGMPPHDGRPQTRFAVLAQGAVRTVSLDYDVTGAVSAMQAAGLTQGYHRSLESGYWPSEDVLPPGLRRPSRASG